MSSIKKGKESKEYVDWKTKNINFLNDFHVWELNQSKNSHVSGNTTATGTENESSTANTQPKSTANVNTNTNSTTNAQTHTIPSKSRPVQPARPRIVRLFQ